eukprot:GHVP01026422.1.p1 GENE.GHVP01026422.1~~GHVP01026422.1.p1  ORF type:complete len:2363 (+),score=409.78 GHVP01026422.1:73-7161(+)
MSIEKETPLIPRRFGLYDVEKEKESCGVGFCAMIDGTSSREIVTSAIKLLVRMAHRGAKNGNDGDGAGILVGMPHSFFEKEIAIGKLHINLPPVGEYGVGMLFFPKNSWLRLRLMTRVEQECHRHGLQVIGWRSPLPTNSSILGPAAKKSEPFAAQVFVKTAEEGVVESKHVRDLSTLTSVPGIIDSPPSSDIPVLKHLTKNLEIRLYLVRKRLSVLRDVYMVSFSSKKLTYKGFMQTEQLMHYWSDLSDDSFKSHMAMVHSRFSTNTFPSWNLSHPFRCLSHNGEINTISANRQWLKARQSSLMTPTHWGKDALISNCFPIDEPSPKVAVRPKGYSQSEFSLDSQLDENDPWGVMEVEDDERSDVASIDFENNDYEPPSDSATLDNILELMVMAGRSIEEAIAMLVPCAWENDSSLPKNIRAFYEHSSHLVEPWDGPALICFSDGDKLGACLDRNGLRPARYLETFDGMFVLASEVGVMDLHPKNIKSKGRLGPGKMVIVDFKKQSVLNHIEIFQNVSSRLRWATALKEFEVSLQDHVIFFRENKIRSMLNLHDEESDGSIPLETSRRLISYGLTAERVSQVIEPLAKRGADLMGCRGNDAPIAALSNMWRNPSDFFSHNFSQVTNPSIDSVRESNVMSLRTTIGPQGDLLSLQLMKNHRLVLTSAMLGPQKFHALVNLPGFVTEIFDLTWSVSEGPEGMLQRIKAIQKECRRAARKGIKILVLSDRLISETKCPIYTSLIVGAVHTDLVELGLRGSVALVVETGDCHEVHQMCLLLALGADAIFPFAAFQAMAGITFGADEAIVTLPQMIETYCDAVDEGIRRIMSKMGVATLSSYKSSLSFVGLGVSQEILDLSFNKMDSIIGGFIFDDFARSSLSRHRSAYSELSLRESFPWEAREIRPLPFGFGDYSSYGNKENEIHRNTSNSVALLQRATRTNSWGNYKEYAEYQEDLIRRTTLRGLMAFKDERVRVRIEDVEPVTEILKRFVAGGMSYGCLSPEAFNAMNIAMTNLNGNSNCGEGGDPFIGSSLRSRTKQVSSGRFGVTLSYLLDADEIQIKVAQGSSPGEGGELPSAKITPLISKTRNSTPDCGLISPAPHHDMYSIEDMAQLIHDLKMTNPKARVSCKLVAKSGVGVIASGIVKAKIDEIIISGGSGDSGAAKWTSIKHAGFPWEMGISETHQTLCINKTRTLVSLQVDGGLKTGRDIVIAALLGADKFSFATAPLIALGCVMARKCHLNICPTGIASNDPELRKKFNGAPEHVINYFYFLAQEVREILANLGFSKFQDLIGRSDLLKQVQTMKHDTSHLDLSKILTPGWSFHHSKPKSMACKESHVPSFDTRGSLDRELIRMCRSKAQSNIATNITTPIGNGDRSVGALLSGWVLVSNFGRSTQTPFTITFTGSAGQSFGLFLTSGLHLKLIGDANDYAGKGLCGGILSIFPPPKTSVAENPNKNIIAGNSCLFGATSGKAFISGIAAERFAVRNSGAVAVVEGCGDHGCEYMTRGLVVVLGPTGHNFAAGMTGGRVFLLDADTASINLSVVELSPLNPNSPDRKFLESLLQSHLTHTGSPLARSLLQNFDESVTRFTKVMPLDIRRVLRSAISSYVRTGSKSALNVLSEWETITKDKEHLPVGRIRDELMNRSLNIITELSSRKAQLKALSIYCDPTIAIHRKLHKEFAEDIKNEVAYEKERDERQGLDHEYFRVVDFLRLANSAWRSLESQEFLVVVENRSFSDLLPRSLTSESKRRMKEYFERQNRIINGRIEKKSDPTFSEATTSASDIDEMFFSESSPSFSELNKSSQLSIIREESQTEDFETDYLPKSPVSLERKLSDFGDFSLFLEKANIPVPDVENIITSTTTKPFVVAHPDRHTGFMLYSRQEIARRNPSNRILDWKPLVEEPQGNTRMYEQLMKTQSARCLGCGTPGCQTVNFTNSGCPLGNRISLLSELVAHGQWKQAVFRLLETNPLPEILGRVCQAPCEEGCVLSRHEGAVTIQSIENAIAEMGFRKNWIKPTVPSMRYPISVAIIGSGPTGLAAATVLNRAGINVTMFERESEIGGFLRYGIPTMILERTVLDRRIKLMSDEGVVFMQGVFIKLTSEEERDTDEEELDEQNERMGKLLHLEHLKKNFTYVLLATGSEKQRDILVRGRNLQGVYFSREFLTLTQKDLVQGGNEPSIDASGKNVVIIGGGQTAIDCLGTAVRMGCASALQFIRSTPPTTSAELEDAPRITQQTFFSVKYAHEEARLLTGSEPRIFATRITEFVHRNTPTLAAVATIKCRVHKDGSITDVPGTAREYPADIAVIACGTEGLPPNKKRMSFSTIDPNVFVAGEAMRIKASVAECVADGRNVAQQIVDAFLFA